MKIVYRKSKVVDIISLIRDINAACVNIITPHFDVDNVSARLDSILQNLLDIHAPLSTRVITCRPKSPWYKNEFRDAKRSKRRAERRYLKSRLAIHLSDLKEECRIYNEILESAKTSYYRTKIDECDNNHLFGFINSLLGKNSVATKLLKHNSKTDLANRFADFFHDKITHLHNSLNCVSNTVSLVYLNHAQLK